MSLLAPKVSENHLQNFSFFLFSLLSSNKHNDPYINMYSQSFFLVILPKFKEIP